MIVALLTIPTFNFAINCILGVQTYYFIYVAGSKTMFSVFTMAKRMSKTQVYSLASIIPTVGLIVLLIAGIVAPQSYLLTALS